MKNVDLKDIDQEIITGHWKVYRRVKNNDTKDYFSDINILDLGKNVFRSVNGKITEGQWKVFRENEIVFNPQIKFLQNDNELANAIITRLFEEEFAGQKLQKLTLYFITGLELILQKEN